MKLPDFAVQDFNGGLVTNKGDFQLNKNEFVNTLNLDFDEFGKAKRRRGIRRFSDISSANIIDNSYAFTLNTLGSSPTGYHVLIDISGNLYNIGGTYTSSAIATTDTSINVGSTSLFAASGNIEIDGDIIAYTGKGTTSFTGCTGITNAHTAYSAVHQVISTVATGIDTRAGGYFALLNNLLFINGRSGSATYDGTTVTAVSDTDEPAGLFATVYRSRMYVAGSGVSDGSGTRNGSPKRVSFSDPGDATSWDVGNYFDVEDDLGEMVTGFKELSDTLLIFKTNSIFAYDEVQLKQKQWGVGAWNHRVVQKIGNSVFTFCPQGVFETNGSSAKDIGQPILAYLKSFRPIYDYQATSIQRVVINCFAGVFENKYILFIENLTEPETMKNVVLIYDTIRKKWTVHDQYGLTGISSFTHFLTTNQFERGAPGVVSSTLKSSTTQFREALFGGTNDGKYFRLYDGRFEDSETLLRTQRGGDIIANMIDDNSGKAISTVLETKWYDLGNPSFWKKVGYLTMFVEQGYVDVFYKLDTGVQSDWYPLGSFNKTTSNSKVLPADKNQCYRIKFRFENNTADVLTIFNGFIVRDIYSSGERRQ